MLRWKDKLLKDVDGKKAFRNSGAYFLLGLSALAMVFFGICTPKGQTGGGFTLSGSAAKIGGERVTGAEFQRAYNNMRERLQQQYQEAFDPSVMQLPKMVMRNLVDERVLYQAALNAGIEAQEDDVVRMLQDAKAFQDDKGGFNTEAFTNYLKRNGYTEASFTEEIRRGLSVQDFREFVNTSTWISSRAAALDYQLSETKIDVEYVKIEPSMAKIVVSDDDVKKFLDDAGKAKVKDYYEKHASEFNTTERVKARHILFAYTGSRNASGSGALRTKEDAKKLATDTVAKAKAPGADFANLASTLTDEPSGKTKGGDLGYFGRGDMVKEFSTAAFGLKVGDISGVVESPFGFHVIKVEDHQDAKVTALDQATTQIAKKLIEQEKAPAALQQKADALLADLKGGKNIDASLKELGAKWEATGLVSIGSGNLPGIGGDTAVLDAVGKLSKPGEVAGKVLDSRGSKLIVKLKSRVDADQSKLDAKKKEELSRGASSAGGYALLSGYQKSLRKELEDKGKIWENPEYLKIGKRDTSASEDVGG